MDVALQKPADVNDSQWQAVTYCGGHLLIIAGPGTGKTHTLIHRILQFIPRLKTGQRILAVTFTNKAAKEMRSRLTSRFANADRQVMAGTFHQFCLEILRERFAGQLPADLQVPSVDEIETLSKNIWPNLKERARKDLLAKISLWKASPGQPAFDELKVYNAALRKKGWLDFDDLLLEAVRCLQNDPPILKSIQEQFPFIFVDEYQDINPAQHQLLKLLVSGGSAITAIGDPHQAIYGFRGSDVKYFAGFEKDFPKAEVMNLSENFRSTQNLLAASSQIIKKQSRFQVPALTARIYKEGRLVIHEAPTDKAEAEYVVHQIEKMVGGTSMFSKDSGRTGHEDNASRSFGEIAVLFRLNSQRALLEEALDRSGIPYGITQERNYEDPEELLVNAFKHNADNDKVSLMTLHASKGLEFPVVFIVGCEEKLLPLELEGLTSDLEEERRLFYVGMTRAKENLFLVRAAKRRLYGKIYETTASPFLADIEEELKEYEKIEAKPRKRDREADQLKLFS